MSSTPKYLAIAACISFAATSALADEPRTIEHQIQTVRSITELERQSSLVRGAQLSESEMQDFVPVYQDYRREVVALNTKLLELLKRYADQYAGLSDAEAEGLTRDSLALERDRIDLKIRYARKFAKVLAGVKVARVLQIENRMDLLQMLGAATTIPLAKP